MTNKPKFKAGDKVSWNDSTGNERVGEVQYSTIPYSDGQIFYVINCFQNKHTYSVYEEHLKLTSEEKLNKTREQMAKAIGMPANCLVPLHTNEFYAKHDSAFLESWLSHLERTEEAFLLDLERIAYREKPKVREIERMPKIKNVVFRPDIRRVTIVFDGFATRATCKEGEEYRPLLGFLIAYFKAVKRLQGWNSKMVQRYFEGVLYYLPPEEQEAYLKAVYFENAKPTFKQALSLFDDVEAYWEKRL